MCLPIVLLALGAFSRACPVVAPQGRTIGLHCALVVATPTMEKRKSPSFVWDTLFQADNGQRSSASLVRHEWGLKSVLRFIIDLFPDPTGLSYCLKYTRYIIFVNRQIIKGVRQP